MYTRLRVEHPFFEIGDDFLTSPKCGDDFDLPETLRLEVEQIEADLTSTPPSAQGEGSVQSTVRQMTEAELDNLAPRIRGLAHAVELEGARQESIHRRQ